MILRASDINEQVWVSSWVTCLRVGHLVSSRDVVPTGRVSLARVGSGIGARLAYSRRPELEATSGAPNRVTDKLPVLHTRATVLARVIYRYQRSVQKSEKVEKSSDSEKHSWSLMNVRV